MSCEECAGRKERYIGEGVQMWKELLSGFPQGQWPRNGRAFIIYLYPQEEDEDEDDYSDVSEEEEGEDDDEAGSDDEENDPDFDPATAQKPEECKQQ